MAESDADLGLLMVAHRRLASLVLLVDVHHRARLEDLKRLLLRLLLELLALPLQPVRLEPLPNGLYFLGDLANLLHGLLVAGSQLVVG